MVFQDPMTSLNPVLRIGHQITETLKLHLKLDRAEAKETALSLLMQVGIPSPVERFDAYPHQLSGGMRQRVIIAIALACAPRLLMADEPTTGLDVTVQAQILDLLSTLQRDREMGMVLVTHDLGVVATRTDEIIVMYAGNVVERAPTEVLFSQMAMPYTEALLRSIPRIGNPSHTRLSAIEGRPPDLISPPPAARSPPAAPTPRPSATTRSHPWSRAPYPGTATPVGSRSRVSGSGSAWVPDRPGPGRATSPGRATCPPAPQDRRARDPLLTVEDLFVSFTRGGQTVQAVAGVSFTLHEGETLGLVGESGCGKSTTGRAIVQVEKSTSGTVTFQGTELTSLDRGDLRQMRTEMQMIFRIPSRR